MAFKEKIVENNLELEAIEEVVESLPTLAEVIAGEETFIPENIREGVDILGIIGSLVGGVDLSSVGITKADCGIATIVDSKGYVPKLTFYHNLGVVPKYAFALRTTKSTSSLHIGFFLSSEVLKTYDSTNHVGFRLGSYNASGALLTNSSSYPYTINSSQFSLQLSGSNFETGEYKWVVVA